MLRLGINNQLHHSSIKCGIQVLRANKFDLSCLQRRPAQVLCLLLVDTHFTYIMCRVRIMIGRNTNNIHSVFVSNDNSCLSNCLVMFLSSLAMGTLTNFTYLDWLEINAQATSFNLYLRQFE